jgi:O-antigen/teichoic acid export membrane protein
MLTRISTKNPTEFGTWSFIFYIISLFSLLSSLFPFWATRFIARGKEGTVKTAVATNFILALIAALIYLPTVPLIMAAFHVESSFLFVYLLAAIQIVNTFMVMVFEGCLRAIRPQVIGYGLLIEEVVKVTLAFVLILGLKQLLLGAMVSLIAAASVQALFYAWLLWGQLKQKIHWGYLREWVKSSPVMLYNVVGTQLNNAVLYILVYFAGQGAMGNYQAAVTFSTVISYASSLAFALYPKMLAGEGAEDIASSFNTMLMLALPMVAVALTMAQSLLTILNASYAVAAPILMLLTVSMLITLIFNFYTQWLLGIETLDIEGKISLRELVHSKIFLVFSIPYIQTAIAAPAMLIILTQVAFANPIEAAMYLVLVNIAVDLISVPIVYHYSKATIKIPVAWKSLGKYVVAAAVMGGALLILPHTTTIVFTFAKILVGVGIYAALLYATDADARKLVKQVFKEIRGNFQ